MRAVVLPTTGFLWAAALVVCQAEDHLSIFLTLRLGHLSAVILHWHYGVIITPIHAAAIFGGLPHLPHGTRGPETVGARWGETGHNTEAA